MRKTTESLKPRGRRCTKCNEYRDAVHFIPNGKHPDGTTRLRSICKPCGSEKRPPRKTPKACTDCKVVKPPSEFNNHGNYSRCKPCQNLATYAYRRGKGREAHNARMQKYVSENYKNDPVFRNKYHARAAVAYALRKGVLVRPSACPVCGRKVRLHAHHHKGYDQQHRLDIEWLCPRCHRAEDQQHKSK